MENFVVWTLTKSEIEADPRDLKAEVVLPVPTAEDLKNLPEECHNEAFIGATYYQNGWGSCTSLGATHSMLIQNVKELATLNPEIASEIGAKLKSGVNPIELDRKDLWTKMGHKLEDMNDSGDYVEKALLTTNKQWIKGKDWNGNDVVFFGLNYADSWNYTNQMLKYWITKYPVVIVISGTNQTWNEMMSGEVKTIIEKVHSTWAHCICICWYDKYWIIVANSRKANDWTKKKCLFRISRANIPEMVKVWMLNRRYRVEFDKKDSVLDLDLYMEENNAIEILKLLTKFYNKTRFKDVQKECGDLGATIRKNYPRVNTMVPKA